METIDKKRMTEALAQAKSEPKLDLSDISPEKQDAMRRRLCSGKAWETLKEIAVMVAKGQTPPTTLIDAIVQVIIGPT